MRFVCKTVPKLVDTPTPWRPDLTPEELKMRHLEMTKDTAQKLLAHESSMKGLPVGLNHRAGPFPGVVEGGYIFEGALYHRGYIDESTPLGQQVAQQIREGQLNNVSLTHLPGENPLSVELSLCVLNGARPGSGIIHVTEDSSSPPAASEPPDEAMQRERNHYLEQRSIVMASQEIQEATVIEVPAYNAADTTTPLVITMTDTPPPEPVAEVSVPPSKSESDLLEEKFQEWDNDRRPADARPGDTYYTYLMRTMVDVKILSTKMRERLMRAHMDMQDKLQQQDQLVRGMGNMVEPLVKKFGARANPPVSLAELREAQHQQNAARLAQIESSMIAVQASEEMAETQAMARIQAEQKLMETKMMVLAQEKAAEAERADRERNRKLAEDMYQRHQVAPPPPPPPPAAAAPAVQAPVAPPPKGVRKMKVADAHPLLNRELAENPRTRLEEVTDELRRILSNPNHEVAISSALEYTQRLNGGTYKPPDASAEYVPGLVAASEEMIYAKYPPEQARDLTSTFNANLDKAVISAVAGGYNMEVDEYLASGRIVPQRESRSLRYRQNDAEIRRNVGSDGGGYRTVNGWKNAYSSLAKCQTMQAQSVPMYTRNGPRRY